MSEEIPWNAERQAEEILTRCRRTVRMWRGVYKTLGVEFQYKEPTADEMLRAIQLEAEKMNKIIQKKKDK